MTKIKYYFYVLVAMYAANKANKWHKMAIKYSVLTNNIAKVVKHG